MLSNQAVSLSAIYRPHLTCTSVETARIHPQLEQREGYCSSFIPREETWSQPLQTYEMEVSPSTRFALKSLRQMENNVVQFKHFRAKSTCPSTDPEQAVAGKSTPGSGIFTAWELDE